MFLVLTVIDSCLVVVTPLLAKHIIDDGIDGGDAELVTVLALAMAGVALVERRAAPSARAGSPRGSARA